MVDPQSSKPGFMASSEGWKTLAAVLGAVAALIGAIGGAWKLFASPETPKPPLASPIDPSRLGTPAAPEDVQALLWKWVSAQRARNIEEFTIALTESATIPFVLDRTLFKNVDLLVKDYADRFKKLTEKYGDKLPDVKVPLARTFQSREEDDRTLYWKDLRGEFGFRPDDYTGIVSMQFPDEEPRRFIYVVRSAPAPRVIGIVPYKGP